jgi:hypothetical protein
MPRFFFHLKRGQVTILDHEGAELADIEQAEKEAARRGREIAARDASEGVASRGAAIVIADAQWRPVFQVPIKDDDA